jgi:prephenate dehydrogenase
MKDLKDCTVGIVGLGLMGGAVAMALRKGGNTAGKEPPGGGPQTGCAPRVSGPPRRILAWDTDGDTLAAAKRSGLIDEGRLAGENEGPSAEDPSGCDPSAGMLTQCDLVILCLNPSTLLRFMKKNMTAFKPGTLITDIAGVKSGIVDYIEKNLREDLDFIPGHPMAGAEKGGFANAGLCNFQGKNYILTPLKRNKPENLEFIRRLIYRMGFGRITETTPAEHDRRIAFTSQLCHVIAAALIDCEGDLEITRFGGGSFEDLTRIAMLNASMWTELFIENRTELLDKIKKFEESLDALKSLISGTREKELEEMLTRVRKRRTAMAERGEKGEHCGK